jgi:hypothetical protein
MISHGSRPGQPRRNSQARAAVASASTASASDDPAGSTGPREVSSVNAQREPLARSNPERPRAARSHPRTVPGGRPRRSAIGRCPAPRALATSAAPITSAPSRRRATQHAGSSTCVTPHPRQHARRGRSRRSQSSSRTVRGRAQPHGASGPPQPGHPSRPAASAPSTASELSTVASKTVTSYTHAIEPRRPLPRWEGASRVGDHDSRSAAAQPASRPYADRRRRERSRARRTTAALNTAPLIRTASLLSPRRKPDRHPRQTRFVAAQPAFVATNLVL